MLLVLWLYFLLKPQHKSESGVFDTRDYIKIKEVKDTMYINNYIYKYKKGDSIPFIIVSIDTTTIHDTVSVVKDYLTVKAYSDTIKIDSSTFVIDDTISQNKILSRGFIANISTRTITTKEYFAEKARYSLYLGIRASFRQDNGLDVLSPSLMLNAKNKALIGLSFDLGKNYSIGYSGSVYLKLSKK